MKHNKILVLLIISILTLTLTTIDTTAINRYDNIEYGERNEIGIHRYINMTGPSGAFWRDPDAHFGYFLLDLDNGSIREIGNRYASATNVQFIGQGPHIFDGYTFDVDGNILRYNSLSTDASLTASYPYQIQYSSYYSNAGKGLGFYYNPLLKTITGRGSYVTMDTPIQTGNYMSVSLPTQSGGIALQSSGSTSGTHTIGRGNNYYGKFTTYASSTGRVYNNHLKQISYPTFLNIHFPENNPTQTSAYSYSNNIYTQYDIRNNLSTIRSVNIGTGYAIRGLEILSNGRLLLTGDYTIAPYTYGFHSIYDSSGNLITGSLWTGSNSTINNPIQIDGSTIGWILHNTDTERHYVEFRDLVTFNLKSGYPREYYQYDDGTTLYEQRVLGLNKPQYYDYGYNPTAYDSANYVTSCFASPCESKSNSISNFDAVPKDVYQYLYDGTKPDNWEYTDIDLTNRRIAVTISDAGNIDNLPILFLLGDGRLNTNELYSYMIREDLNHLQTINTGLLGGASGEDYSINLSNIIANNNFYVFDINMSIERTSSNDKATANFFFSDTNTDFVLPDLSQIGISPTYSINREYLDRNNSHLLGSNVYLSHQKDRPALLIGYHENNTKELDYINLRLYLDTHNNMHSVKMMYAYDGESMQDAGFTYYLSSGDLHNNVALRYIQYVIASNTESQMTIDVYRRTNVPVMTTRGYDTTFTQAKVMEAQILREGKNTIEVAYSPSGSGQHANNVVWEYDVTMINGAILGIPSTILPQPDPSEGGGSVEQGSELFGGLLPDFMPTTQQSAMMYSMGIILLVMIIVFLIGAGGGYPLIGFVGSLFFGFMLLIFFSLFGWIPAWIPVIGFVVAGLLGAGIIRNSLSGGSA